MIRNFVIRNFVPASWAHLCVSSTVQQSVLSPEVSVLQQLVFHLDVSVQQQPVLCQKMAYSSLWCTWTACLQEPVLHRDVSVYKSFCVHLRCLSNTIYGACAVLMSVCLQELLCAPEVSVDYKEPVLHLFLSVYKSFVSTWKCLSSRALLHLCISVYQSFVLHLCLSAV